MFMGMVDCCVSVCVCVRCGSAEVRSREFVAYAGVHTQRAMMTENGRCNREMCIAFQMRLEILW